MEVVRSAEAKHGPRGRRIVRVMHPQHGGQFDGDFGGAPIVDGKPGYQWNDGERVAV